MSEPLQIGNVSAEPGTINRGSIETGINLCGCVDGIPVLVYRGINDGPVLWLNGAIHGDEPEGPFSIHKTMVKLDTAKMTGTVVFVPAMNVHGFQAGQRGNPLDSFSYDMNRIYPGRAEGYLTERVADAHWQVMKDKCDLQIAIHSGGDHSYLAHMVFAADNPQSLELAAAMGPQWDLVFKSGVGGANPASKIAELDKAGITIELGGNCRSLTRDFHEVAEDLSESYLNVMRHYGMIEGDAAHSDRWRMGHQQPLLAPASGMWVGNPDLEFEKELPAGTLLGQIYSLYGDLLAEVCAPDDGIVFGLRSRPAVLEGDWCCFFGIIDETRDDLIAT